MFGKEEVRIGEKRVIIIIIDDGELLKRLVCNGKTDTTCRQGGWEAQSWEKVAP